MDKIRVGAILRAMEDCHGVAGLKPVRKINPSGDSHNREIPDSKLRNTLEEKSSDNGRLKGKYEIGVIQGYESSDVSPSRMANFVSRAMLSIFSFSMIWVR